MSKKKSGIYRIRNMINNKSYIGQSINLNSRINKHKNLLRKGEHQNKHLQLSWNKYGEENFKFEILEECDIKCLDEKENFYIKKFNSNNNDFGYNHRIDNKTNRNLKWSDEQRKKMEIIINDENSWYKNHKIPLKTQEKAWETTRNRKWTEEQRKRHSEILKGTKVKNTGNMKKAQQGSKNPSSKLSENEVKEIICLCKSKIYSFKDIALCYNVSLGTINSISIERTWKHIERNKIDSMYFDNGNKKIKEFMYSVNERVIKGEI